MNAMFDLNRFDRQYVLQHLPTLYFVSDMYIITRRQVIEKKKTDCDRRRVRSNRRIFKGNDTGFG